MGNQTKQSQTIRTYAVMSQPASGGWGYTGVPPQTNQTCRLPRPPKQAKAIYSTACTV